MSGVEVSVTNTAAHTADTPQLLLEHHLKELRCRVPAIRVRHRIH
jgi:hypothetical protein